MADHTRTTGSVTRRTQEECVKEEETSHAVGSSDTTSVRQQTRAESQQGEQRERSSERLLLAISRVQSLFIDDAEPESVFGAMLQEILVLTGSEYGFIGEVLQDPEQQPYLRVHAITGRVWNEATKALMAQRAPNLEFKNLKTLFGRVMTSGRPVIANDPLKDPRAAGFPPGHPPIHAFLGIPIRRGDSLTGMVGVANRPGGYDEAVTAYLGPLLSTCAQLVEGYRNRRLRAAAEEALRQSEDRFRAAIQGANHGIWDWNLDTKETYFSPRWKAILGYDDHEIPSTYHEWESRLHPDDRDQVLAQLGRYLDGTAGRYDAEFRMRKKHGDYCWIHACGSVICDADRRPARMAGSHEDITERKQEEALQSAEKQALELVAKGTLLTDVLVFICRAVDAQMAPMLCSVMLVTEDGAHLSSTAGPSLPEEYYRAISRVPIGPTGGSCGSAAYFRKPAIVADIASDPLWQDYVSVALPHGLRACWSLPIMSSTSRLLGTLAVYHREPRQPQPTDLKILGRVSQIAALAIEHATMTEALRASEARFDAFMRHSPAITFIKDEAGHHVYVNPQFETLFGVSKEAIKGKTAFDFLPRDVATRLHENDQTVFSSGQSIESEEIVPMPSGRAKHWLVIKFPLEVGARRLLGGVAVDMTERKRVEERLLRTQFTMDQAVDAVYWIDPEANILYTNEAASAMLGYTANEFLRMTVHDLNPEFPREVWPAFWERTREQKVISLETVHLTKDGRRIPIEIRVGFLAHDGQEFHCAFVRDISERKRVDQALRASQERFELAVKASNDGIWDWNILTGEQYWSDRHLELLGLTPGELAPTYDKWISMLHPDDAELVHHATRRHLETRASYDLEVRVRMKDGSYRWFRDRGQAVWDESGRPVRMVGSVSDVTERRQAEEAIWKAHAELEQRVVDRTKELATTNRALEAEIAERKRVEDRLQRTQYAVDHAADQIFVIDSKGYFLDVNESACRRLGYTKEELLSMSVMDIDPDFPPEAWDACWAAVIREGQRRIETRHRSKAGEIYPVEVVANYLYHGGQELDCAIVRDVTERKRIEDRLQRTQYAVDHAADQIFVIGSNGYFLDVNHAACRRLGYAKEELLKLSVMDIDADCPPELWHQVWAEFTDKKGLRLERRHRSKTGEIYPVEVLANYIDHQGQALSYSIVRDVTERRQAEAAIRESELRYKLLTEATFDGVALHDDGVLLEVNPGLERMFGYQPGELIGRSIFDLVVPEQRAQAVANMRKGVEGPYEIMGLRKDGNLIPGEVVVRPYWYRGKQVRLVAGRDITLRKQLEAEKTRHLEELERQVVERTAEIAKLESQRTQVEKLAAVGQLAAAVAHEINNPIAGIKNAFALVKQAVDPAHPHYEFVGMIDREISRVATIVQNMYQLYRKEPSKVGVVDLHPLLRDLDAVFAKRMSQRGIRCDMTVPPEAVVLQVPQGDLLQVLMNLLQNAIDASNPGETIRLHVVQSEESVRITVSDEGEGIAPEVLPHIFDPFFTTKTNQNQKGMGLGLSVTQSLVMAMGGRIEVQTQLNAGSTFSVVLPRSMSAAGSAAQQRIIKEVLTHGS